MSIRISVIVPIYRDWERLDRCLAALARQTLDPGHFEVIVVNNESQPRDAAGPLPDNARILHEPRPGSYSARNRAVEVARGEFLAFTDSDCVPEPDWLERGHDLLARNPGIRVTGPVRIFREDGSGYYAFLYDLYNAFQQSVFVGRGYCVTANLLVSKSVFDRVGRFNESMLSGGDREWGLRATADGIPLVYDEAVAVSHPARPSVSSILRRKRRIAGAEAQRSRYRTHKYVLVRLIPPGLGPALNAQRARGKKALTRTDFVMLYAVNWLVKLSEALEFLLVRLGVKKANRA